MVLTDLLLKRIMRHQQYPLDESRRRFLFPVQTGNTGATVVMSICTVLILFLEDVKLAFLGHEWDDAVMATEVTLLALFTLDLVATTIARPRFCLGAVFWLEVAANISLFLEIPIFAELVIGQHQEIFDIDDGASVAAAPVTSRAGGRANKAATEGKRQGMVTFNSLGDKLAGRAMYSVVILALCLLLVLPFFDADLGLYGMPPIFKIGGLKILHDLAVKSGVSSREFRAALKVYLKDAPTKLAGQKTSEVIYLMAANSTILSKHLLKRRPFEVSAISFSTDECNLSNWDGCKVTEAIFDIKWPSQFKAIMGISQTLFIMAIVSIGPALMSRHLYVLVVRPLRVVVEKVKDVADHPMQPATSGHRTRMKWAPEVRMLENSIMKICNLLIVAFGEAGAALIGDNMKEAGALNPMLPGKKVRGVFGFVDIQQFADVIEVLQAESMEFVNAVAQIVHTEVKLHGGIVNKNVGEAFLLAWKFSPEVKWKNVKDMIVKECDGELNVQRLVVERASRRSSNASTLNTSRIEDSSLTSRHSVLLPRREETVKSLENATTRRSQSLPLLRSSKEVPEDNPSTEEPSNEENHFGVTRPRSSTFFSTLSEKEKREINAVADNALAAFVVIHTAMKRSVAMEAYANRKDIKEQLSNFTVRLGFGLHVGWAIEGAIGSEYKIDASYLSPHVNMASRLEAATKQFGVTILMSRDFVRCLSPKMQNRVRQIDNVLVKGSKHPVGLFTYDINLGDTSRPPAPSRPKKLLRYSTFSSNVYGDRWIEHPDLAPLVVSKEFLGTFAEGFQAYTSGIWERARECFEESRQMRKDLDGVDDGPSVTLLNFMEKHSFLPPTGWKGCRRLTDK
ncbi:hypothetical protein BSKO_00633 [Bryopsis sp. KO-2023]|nr:hypothetical protein BSKO_00633 [Bryopsis sp. KO-2023]